MSEQWEGCEEVHWDCRIAQLEADNSRLTALVERLKEDGERLAKLDGFCCLLHENWQTLCAEEDTHTYDCPITLHRALMKELEEK